MGADRGCSRGAAGGHVLHHERDPERGRADAAVLRGYVHPEDAELRELAHVLCRKVAGGVDRRSAESQDVSRIAANLVAQRLLDGRNFEIHGT